MPLNYTSMPEVFSGKDFFNEDASITNSCEAASQIQSFGRSQTQYIHVQHKSGAKRLIDIYVRDETLIIYFVKDYTCVIQGQQKQAKSRLKKYRYGSNYLYI